MGNYFSALPNGKTEKMSFAELVARLKSEVKGVRLPDGTIQDEQLMRQKADQLLKSYNANEHGWRKYEFWDPKRMKYYRNLVAEGEGWILLILCWPEDITSPIHDHSNADCLVKILQGSLLETRYKMPTSILNESCSVADRLQMEKIGESLYTVNNVSYMTDEIGLHSMHNPSHSEGAISLHLYFPSFTRCRCFDETTSISHEGQMVWHTAYGKKTEHFDA